jgi:hypothetical protein
MVATRENEMTNTNEMRIALERIRDLAKPGQEMGISEAIDALCDIWNVARAGLAANVEGETT